MFFEIIGYIVCEIILYGVHRLIEMALCPVLKFIRRKITKPYVRWLSKVVRYLQDKWPYAYQVVIKREGKDTFDPRKGKVVGILTEHGLYDEKTAKAAAKWLVTEYTGKRFF